MNAEDLKRRARESGARGESWNRFTSDICEEVEAFDAAGNPRAQVDEMEAAWREGRRERRLANGWVVRWTTASEDYDTFGTETVEHCGDWSGKKLRSVLIDPHHLDYQEGRYASGLHGSWDEDPRVVEERRREQLAREKAENEARAERRRLGLEWLATADDALVDGDDDALDDELRARGLRWEDGRDERRNRRAKREADERAATWARCRAAVPDGASLIDLGKPGYQGHWGWVAAIPPRAWRAIKVRDYDTGDAKQAAVIDECGDMVGRLLDIADGIAKGEMRLAGPDEHVPPKAVVERVGVPFTEIVRCLDGTAWAGRPRFGFDVLVLDDRGHLIRKRAVREAAVGEYLAKRRGATP